MGKESNVIGVRFNPELLKRLDEEVDKRQKATPWQEVTRADVVRELLWGALVPKEESGPIQEKEEKKEPPPSQGRGKARKRAAR